MNPDMPNAEDWINITTILRSITADHDVTIGRDARWTVTIGDNWVSDEHLGYALVRCAYLANVGIKA